MNDGNGLSDTNSMQKVKCDVCQKNDLNGYTRFNGHGTICDHCADFAMIKAIDDASKARKQNKI